MPETFSTNEDYQLLLLACLVRRQGEFDHLVPIIKPAWFDGTHATLACEAMLEHNEKYGRFPSFTVLAEQLRRKVHDIDPTQEDLAQKLVDRVEALDVTDWEQVRDELIRFARIRAVVGAIKKSARDIADGKTPDEKMVEEMRIAISVGEGIDDIGLILHQDYAALVKEMTRKKRGVFTGYPKLDRIWRNGWQPGWLIVPLAPPKRFKCQSPDTQVLMYDGSTKKISEIEVGDNVMGDDSTPRKVISCGHGHGPMYAVTQSNGDNYTVTSDHVLCLQRPDNTIPVGRFKGRYHLDPILEMTAEEYSKHTEWFQRTWKGYKVGVRFPTTQVPLDPYFLGLWLGDGSTGKPSVEVSEDDPKILDFLHNFAASEGADVNPYRKKGRCVQFNFVQRPGARNPVTEKLTAAGVFYEKHVPKLYKNNDRETRLQLLAGLMDSDGGYIKNRGLVFNNTNKIICDDACWIARSLELKSFVRKVSTCCTVMGKKVISHAFRTYVQGNISVVPTRVARKMVKNSVKSTCRTTLKVKSIGEGPWCGIEIDGNRRYLLGDFTVTHNSATCVNLALNMVRGGDTQHVLYYACEISQEQTMLRALMNITGLKDDYLNENPEKFTQVVGDKLRAEGCGWLVFKSFKSHSASIGDIESHARSTCAKLKIAPSAIFIDYAETIRPTDTDLTDWRQQAAIYVQARALGERFRCPVIMPDRCNAETVDKTVPSMRSFQGSFQKAGVVDIAFGICATEEEHVNNTIRIFVFLNRHGKPSQHILGRVDPGTWRIELNEDIPYEPNEEEARGSRRKGRMPRGLADGD